MPSAESQQSESTLNMLDIFLRKQYHVNIEVNMLHKSRS